MDTIFKKYKSLKVYYKTSDGTPFFEESIAKNHAKTLEDKKVTSVKRIEKTKVFGSVISNTTTVTQQAKEAEETQLAKDTAATLQANEAEETKLVKDVAATQQAEKAEETKLVKEAATTQQTQEAEEIVKVLEKAGNESKTTAKVTAKSAAKKQPLK